MSNREREGYNYATLAEAVKLVGETVHFYGVVAAYEQPKPTRGRGLLSTQFAGERVWTEFPCLLPHIMNIYVVPFSLLEV